jgi:hypothetical protein
MFSDQFKYRTHPLPSNKPPGVIRSPLGGPVNDLVTKKSVAFNTVGSDKNISVNPANTTQQQLSQNSSLLYGSQNYFLGQNPPDSSSTMDEILLLYPPQLKSATDSIATIPVNIETAEKTTTQVNNIPKENLVDYDYEIPLEEKLLADEARIPILSDMMNLDMWGWMEKMLDILPKPIINMTALGSQKRQEGTVM